MYRQSGDRSASTIRPFITHALMFSFHEFVARKKGRQMITEQCAAAHLIETLSLAKRKGSCRNIKCAEDVKLHTARNSHAIIIYVLFEP